MSKEFMSICAHERTRLKDRITSTEKVLDLYRKLWKLYQEMEQCSEAPATFRAARAFLERTVSPALKEDLARHKETLENVTRAQEQGCMEIANGN